MPATQHCPPATAAPPNAHLLEQAVDGGLVADLEQGGYGQGGDGAVLVGDERLHVDVAVGHSHGVRHRHLRDQQGVE